VELIHGLRADRVRENLERVRDEIVAAAQRAGRSAAEVEILAATKYVPLDEIGVLAQAGLTLAGENRAQDLEAKAGAHPELQWDFIGHLQSRKVKVVVRHARLIHSVASDSVLRELGRQADPATEVLVEVNVAREPGKSGIAPEQLDAFLERCPVRVTGLMTMPPLAADPEDSRRWFAQLAQLAAERRLPRLSMGTTQDYTVAVEEGATIVRLGATLYT
jgi:hypothetical protein